MARDPDTIQREIERARDALADSLDALGEKASPKRLVDAGKLGSYTVGKDGTVLLGDPYTFNKDNIADFNF